MIQINRNKSIKYIDFIRNSASISMISRIYYPNVNILEDYILRTLYKISLATCNE